jgi:hypothetical protein
MLAVTPVQVEVNTGIFLVDSVFSFLFANPWVSTLVILVIVLLILRLLLSLLRKILLRGSAVPAALKMNILMVTVPKESLKKKDGKEETAEGLQGEIGVAENIFSVLGGLRAQRGLKHWLLGRTDHFAVEIVAREGKIYFYVAIPDYLRDTLEQQLNSSYPYAYIEQVEDYNIFSPQGTIVGGYLRFGRDFIFPIKTYRKTESDPLNTLTNALSKVKADAGAAIQLVGRSAHKKWHNKGVVVAKEMQQGLPLSSALKKAGLGNFFDRLGGAFGFFSGFLKQGDKKNQLGQNEEVKQLSPMEAEVVKGIEEKTSKAGLEVNIRIVVSAPTKPVAISHLNNIFNAFSQFNVYQYGNGFVAAKRVGVSQLVSDFIHRGFIPKYSVILNSEEMASLWHLPLPSSETPNIHWLEARRAPAPTNTPKEGLLLGENVYRGITTPIYIKEKDRMRHTYIIGKSGTGKSVLQSNMIVQDILNGRGLCVIDPHGDLVDGVIEHIPPERLNDVILFDPGDSEYPVGLNMLEFHNPEQKTFAINEIINIFDKLYDLKSTGGPMFEQYMRNAMLLMMEDPDSGSTLLEVPKVLADANFRRYKLSKCVNPVVRAFWEEEAEKAGGEASLANMVPYITSKLTPFVSSDLIRPIIAQQKSSFNFREVMDTKKILLIKLSKGKIGDISANLLGMIIVGKILMAALSRVDVPENERNEFYLYIDEFQNFITDSIAIILSEARKYQLGLIVAHQYIGQLVKKNDTSIKEAIFGNVGTQICFRIGPEDAEFMAKQFAPVFNEFDLLNPPTYSAYVKLLIDNNNPPPFNMKPYAPKSGDKTIINKVREITRQNYARPRAEIEREILERTQIAKRPASPTF